MIVTGTASREEVQNIATGAVELAPKREVDDVSQLPHTTHPRDDITHHIHHFHADTARMLVAECDPFCARPACFENRCCWLDSGYMLTVFTR